MSNSKGPTGVGVFSVGVSQVLISIALLLRQAENRDRRSLRKKKSQLLRIFSIWKQTDKTWPGGVKHTFCVVSVLPSAAQPSHFLIRTSSRVGFFFSTCHNLLIADKETSQKADRYGSVKSGDDNSQLETLHGRNSTTAGVEFFCAKPSGRWSNMLVLEIDSMCRSNTAKTVFFLSLSFRKLTLRLRSQIVSLFLRLCLHNAQSLSFSGTEAHGAFY